VPIDDFDVAGISFRVSVIPQILAKDSLNEGWSRAFRASQAIGLLQNPIA
jgi:hypothetical protein